MAVSSAIAKPFFKAFIDLLEGPTAGKLATILERFLSCSPYADALSRLEEKVIQYQPNEAPSLAKELHRCNTILVSDQGIEEKRTQLADKQPTPKNPFTRKTAGSSNGPLDLAEEWEQFSKHKQDWLAQQTLWPTSCGALEIQYHRLTSCTLSQQIHILRQCNAILGDAQQRSDDEKLKALQDVLNKPLPPSNTSPPNGTFTVDPSMPAAQEHLKQEQSQQLGTFHERIERLKKAHPPSATRLGEQVARLPNQALQELGSHPEALIALERCLVSNACTQVTDHLKLTVLQPISRLLEQGLRAAQLQGQEAEQQRNALLGQCADYQNDAQKLWAWIQESAELLIVPDAEASQQGDGLKYLDGPSTTTSSPAPVVSDPKKEIAAQVKQLMHNFSDLWLMKRVYEGVCRLTANADTVYYTLLSEKEGSVRSRFFKQLDLEVREGKLGRGQCVLAKICYCFMQFLVKGIALHLVNAQKIATHLYASIAEQGDSETLQQKLVPHLTNSLATLVGSYHSVAREATPTKRPAEALQDVLKEPARNGHFSDDELHRLATPALIKLLTGSSLLAWSYRLANKMAGLCSVSAMAQSAIQSASSDKRQLYAVQLFVAQLLRQIHSRITQPAQATDELPQCSAQRRQDLKGLAAHLIEVIRLAQHSTTKQQLSDFIDKKTPLSSDGVSTIVEDALMPQIEEGLTDQLIYALDQFANGQQLRSWLLQCLAAVNDSFTQIQEPTDEQILQVQATIAETKTQILKRSIDKAIDCAVDPTSSPGEARRIKALREKTAAFAQQPSEETYTQFHGWCLSLLRFQKEKQLCQSVRSVLQSLSWPLPSDWQAPALQSAQESHLSLPLDRLKPMAHALILQRLEQLSLTIQLLLTQKATHLWALNHLLCIPAVQAVYGPRTKA